MVGQKKNLKTVIQWRLNKSIPRFIIIEGDVGSGRLTLAKIIMKLLGNGVICENNSKEAVKNAIRMSYNITQPTVYIFRDVDDMSVYAKNALLKVVEEPPNKSYFIMTVKDSSNLIGTLWSRAVKLKMEPYSQAELIKFSEHEEVIKYANTIGQVLSWKNTDVKQAEIIVNDCFNALYSRRGSHLLKATSRLRSKVSEESKLDCELFMRVFTRKFPEFECPDDCMIQILDAIEVCKKEFKTGSLNKKASIEVMLINILRVLKNAEIS